MTPSMLQVPLRSFGIEESAITEISGRAHRSWRIESVKSAYILKQYKDTDLESLQKSIELQEHLRIHSIPIPTFKTDSSGNSIVHYEKTLYVLTTNIDHIPLSAPTVELQILKQAASSLGLLHKINQNIYQVFLKKIDFSSTTNAVTELILQFREKYTSLINTHPDQSKKLEQLLAIVNATEPLRNRYNNPFFAGLWVCIHGDYTPDNMLIEQTSGKLFIIDWDNTKIAPRAFEIHKAIGAFCGLAPLNAYLVPIDWEKAEVFLQAYHKVNPLTEEVINEIVTSAAYGSSTYWLRFTLLQTLAGDFRMLDLLPAKIEDCLFWKNNLNKYRRFLMTIVK